MQEIEIVEGTKGVDWAELAALYRDTRAKFRTPEQVETAFAASFQAVTARTPDGRVIGAARAVSDGVFHATVLDVAVTPAYQGQGVGRALMERLLAHLPFETVYLVSTHGKRGFYEKLGFLSQVEAMGLGIRAGGAVRPPLRVVAASPSSPDDLTKSSREAEPWLGRRSLDHCAA